jgi:DNA-binding XRE family transcriptional regulator
MLVDVDPALVGANIAHARKRKTGVTQDAVAKAVGISRPTYIAIEAGQRLPTELQFHAIARYLEASVRDILSLAAPDAAVSVRFRRLRGAEQSQDALEALEEYGRRYATLERLAQDRIVLHSAHSLRHLHRI